MGKKIFILLLSAVMAFSCVACKGGGTTSSSDSGSASENGGNDGDFGTDYAEYNYNSGIDLQGAKYTLVENGAAHYSILVSSEPSDLVVETVAEFNDYVYEVSGTYLSIVKEGTETPAKFISFGDTSAKAQAGIDTSKIKYDGFVIKTVSGNAYLAANVDEGVRNAAYSFLERFVGVRWLTAQETYVPTSKVISMQECDIVEEPLFEARQWMNGDYLDKEYFKHLRYYTGEERWCQEVPTGHNSTDSSSQPGLGYVNKSDIAPDGDGTEKLGDKHPEYFSDYTNPGPKNYELCYTNGIDENGKLTEGQSVASLMIDKMKQFLTADTEKKQIEYLMLGHVDDRSAICKCNTCSARRDAYTDSGILIMFLNVVSEKVNTWLTETQGRTVRFVTFAYQYTATPPVEENDDGTFTPLSPLVVCNDDIVIRIAPIDADYTYSFTDDRQLDSQLFLMNGWSTVAKHFMIWDYVCNYVEYYWYFPNLNYLKENIVKYQEMGVIYCMFQSSYTQKGIWHDDMRSYICSKLMWNIHWDIEYLMNEYIELYYGEGADTVKAVVNSFENFYTEQRDKGELAVDLFEATGSYVNNESNQNPKEWLNGIVRLLENGIKAVENDPSLSETEKGGTVYKLEGVLITPMRMILRNYNSYYLDGKIDYAIKFFDIVDAHGIKYFGETDIRSVATRKRECGLA